jgi:hypothetical protein
VKPLLLVTVAAAVGISLIGFALGDPRAASEMSRASAETVLGLMVAIIASAIAWRAGRAKSFLVFVPTVILAIAGGLCGWISAAEITHEPDLPVRLADQPARAAFMVALTALGIALPALGVTGLAGLFTPRERAGT